MRYALTNTGYLSDSPDRFNDFNIIPSNRITMKGVNFPVLGIDNKGNSKVMLPGKDYKFKGSQVTEIPLRQRMQFAGQVKQDATRTTNQDDRFWGIQRGVDSQSMRENEFNSKYPKGRTLHQLRMDTDPAYKARLEWESRQRQEQGRESFVNMPATDLRRKDVMTPNQRGLAAGRTGEVGRSHADFHGDIMSIATPFPLLESAGKIPSIKTAAKSLLGKTNTVNPRIVSSSNDITRNVSYTYDNSQQLFTNQKQANFNESLLNRESELNINRSSNLNQEEFRKSITNDNIFDVNSVLNEPTEEMLQRAVDEAATTDRLIQIESEYNALQKLASRRSRINDNLSVRKESLRERGLDSKLLNIRGRSMVDNEPSPQWVQKMFDNNRDHIVNDYIDYIWKNESYRNINDALSTDYAKNITSEYNNLFSDPTNLQLIKDERLRRFQERSRELKKLRKDANKVVRNRTGMTKEEVIAMKGNKDPDKIRNMSDEEFRETVSKPQGDIGKFLSEKDVPELVYNEQKRSNNLKDAIPMERNEYVNEFNSRLDKLNEIIASNNKSGVNYEVKKLDETGRLVFYTPEQKTVSGTTIKPGYSEWGVDINPGQWRGEVKDILSHDYYKSIPGLNMSNTTASVFSDHTARKGSGAYKSINEYLKMLDLGRVKPGFNSQTHHSRSAWENFVNSGRATGYYHNSRTVYGAMKNLLLPSAAGAALQQKQKGGEMKIKNKKGTKLDHGVIYQQGGENDKSENFGRTLLNAGSRALGAIGDTFSIPQRYIMQGLTGEYQDPSEAWGFENVENPQSFPTPFGYIADTNDLRNIANFGMDAVLDPMNVLGAGIAKSFLKGAKSGSVAMRGSRAASNNYPSLEKINQFYKNSYKSPVRTKKAEEVADNNLLQMRLRDANEYDIDRLNYEDFEIQDGLKDVYKSIRETPEDLLSSDLAMFKNKSYDEFAEGFAGVKKYTPKQVLMKTKWNKEATDINPLYGSEVGDAISRSLYEKMKTSGISPYKKFYNNSEGLGKEINNAQTDYFDKVVNRRRLENRHTNILDETPSAIHPTTIKYNKYGGEYQQGGEWSPGMMFQPNTEFKTDFTPDPLDMMPMSDFEFNSNQRKIDLNRTPQINNMLRDSSQMVNPITRPLEKGIDVPERPSLSKISPSPKMPGIKDDRPRGSYDSGWGLRRAAIGTLALNVASNFTDNTDTQYENMMRKYGNSFEQYNPTAADRGDYTLNAGLGSNFRPDYQEGGEYDVSEAELEYLKSQGYDIELL